MHLCKNVRWGMTMIALLVPLLPLSAGPPARAGKIVADDSIVGPMVFVPPTGPKGFLQGSPPGEPCRWKDEKPFTHVLTRPLAVMQREVSRRMWAALRAVQSSLPEDPTQVEYGGGPDNPVQSVTWNETILFANLLSIQNGLTPCYTMDESGKVPIDSKNYNEGVVKCNFDASGYRLPTEGEWEYFARAGTTTPFFVKENLFSGKGCYSCPEKPLKHLDPYAWLCFNGEGKTHTVGTKKSNPWNLENIIGNVRELVWDWQGDYPTGKKMTDYAGPQTGRYKVVRGASVFCYPRGGRSANRYGGGIQARGWGIGFRLVRTLGEGGKTKRSR